MTADSSNVALRWCCCPSISSHQPAKVETYDEGVASAREGSR